MQFNCAKQPPFPDSSKPCNLNNFILINFQRVHSSRDKNYTKPLKNDLGYTFTTWGNAKNPLFDIECCKVNLDQFFSGTNSIRHTAFNVLVGIVFIWYILMNRSNDMTFKVPRNILKHLDKNYSKKTSAKLKM